MSVILRTAHQSGNGLLTRAEWDQGGSRGFQEEGGGPLPLLDTGHHLDESKLYDQEHLSLTF